MWVDVLGLSDFFRGGKGGVVSFLPTPRDYKIKDGLVQATHGVSIFNNTTSVTQHGFEAFRVSTETLPESLKIIQRGKDLNHFEIVPRSPMPPVEYQAALARVQATPATDQKRPRGVGCSQH
jgi:hypothetical protein